MGAGTSEETLKTFESLLRSVKKPMVIDADGLNMLAKNKEMLELIPPGSVLTPHPKELERLIGKWKDDFEKINKAKKFSGKYDVVLVMKDAKTLVIYKDEIYINNTGNPGMATAGRGCFGRSDNRTYFPKISTFNAAVLGTYIHGKAGDIAASKLSYQGMISGDITMNLGNAFLDLFINDSE
jgi:ADP-dependent NAD(P)H-hydrate dehydratase / NAD(P)H-hydrate epimerase